MKRPPSLALIFITVFVHLVGFGIVIPVLPLYADRFGASAFQAGMLLASYSAAQIMFAPILGRISDRVGRKPVLMVSILGTAVGFFLMGMADSLPVLFWGRILDGVTGGNVSTAQAYIADVTPLEDRSKRMGLIGAAFGLGFIFGPALGGILSHISMAAPFLFAAGMAVLNALFVKLWLPESLPPSRRVTGSGEGVLPVIFHLWRVQTLNLIFATYLVVTIAFSLLTATYPLFAQDRFSCTVSQVGYIFAGLGLMSALIQGGLLGWLVKVFGDAGLVMLGAVILAAGFFLLPLSAGYFSMVAATGVVALGHSLVAAPLNGLASKTVSPGSQGQVLGAMQAIASFARIVGPIAGGVLFDFDAARNGVHVGISPYFAAGAMTLGAFLLAFMLQRSVRREMQHGVLGRGSYLP
ncbi:MAG: MFS transporter [Candidatus Omnitrophica bacterium]|nr:MFS transporter [Candidatus Omnitrophota bacterium]